MPINKVFTPNLTQVGKYLRSQPREILESDFPLASLDMKKLEGIQSEIALFQGVSMPEIKFLTKWFEAFLQSLGCKELCSDCLRNSKLPIKETKTAINTIKWEDNLRFVDGFKALNERLGFNVFKGNSYIAPFDNSNLPRLMSLDNEGNPHNIKEVAANIYEKLNIPVSIATAGIDKNDAYTQKASKELVEYWQKNPDAVSEFVVSINPFHWRMQAALNAANAGKPELARTYKEAHTDNIANTLHTFLPLYEMKKGGLIYTHANELTKNAGFRADETAQLYREIYSKLEQLSGRKLDYIEALNPDKVTEFSPKHLIQPKGRGMKYFSDSEIFQKQLDLSSEKLEWENLSPAQRANQAYQYTLKGININGEVYLTTPSEVVIPTDIKLNFENKNKITAPLYSDITMSALSKNDVIKNL